MLSSLIEEEKQKLKKNKGNIEKEKSENENQNSCKDSNDEFKGIIGSLVEEMKCLRETVHHDITDLQSMMSQQKMDISKLEEMLSDSQKEIRKYIIDKIELNTENINSVMEENKVLKRENDKLKERMSQIEKSQLENNVLISGQPEQPWESYELTKERVLDTIATSLGSTNMEIACKTARNTEISGKSRPISVTLQKKR